MTTLPREVINQLPEYSFPDLSVPSADRIIVLAQNELALPPSPKAINAATDGLQDMNRYSDISQVSLREAIASVHGLDFDKLVCGAGSLELMQLIANAYCESGFEVVVSQYGYKMFQVLCSVAGANIRVVAEPGMRVDIDAISDVVTEQTRIVFIVNPGNPTGLSLDPGEVAELRRRLPDSTMLILDSAYAEFADEGELDDGFDLVDQGQNVVVLRTFSKAYGLAGMRVGWAYAPEDVASSILKIRTPNSISSPSLAAAEAAILDRDYLGYVKSEVSRLRTRFIEFAASLGLSALPSVTNFVLLECGVNQSVSASELNSELRKSGIILRPMGSYELTHHLRVSIGTAEEMEILESEMTRILG